jgi:DNA-binding GntR family transcriptional regulator
MRFVVSLIEAGLAVSFRLSSPASDPAGIAECAANHLKIVEANESRDEEAIRRAMLQVINAGVEHTRKAFAPADG